MSERQVLSLYENLSLPQADPNIDYNDPANKIITPVDENGLIKIPDLLLAVRATLDPDYKITGTQDDHHYYYYDCWYPYVSSGPNPYAFRNLPIHIGHMPRPFHQWIEKVTIPADVPSPAVMQIAVETFNIQKNMFRTERERIRWERRLRRREMTLAEQPADIHRAADDHDSAGIDYSKWRAERYERGIRRRREHLESIPEGLQLADLSSPPSRIAAQLGAVVMKRSMPTSRLLEAA